MLVYDRDNFIEIPFGFLEGLQLKNLEVGGEQIDFITHNGIEFVMLHEQDCCERVVVEDVCGEVEDLTNTMILRASSDSRVATEDEASESGTWTFYNISSIKGSLTIRWLGTSNGYYSEGVGFFMNIDSFKSAPREDHAFMVLKHPELFDLMSQYMEDNHE
jgi:hypothetical protein